MRIIKENENIHLEINNGNSLFNHNGKYELLAHRSSHSIYNFVRVEATKENEIDILKDWFKIINDTLSINKVDYIPVLVDDTIEDKL